MAHETHHFVPDPELRDRHDSGRAGNAWRWFSSRTMRRAQLYRDLSWRHVGRHMIAALALVLISRLMPNEGVSPFLLVGGVLWAAVLGRIAIVKAMDHWSDEGRARRGAGR